MSYTFLENLKSDYPEIQLPNTPAINYHENSQNIYFVTNGDLRLSANQTCWPVQKKVEEKLTKVLEEKFNKKCIRAHQIKENEGHGFIGSQREGSDVFRKIDPQAKLIVLLTAWQYSHHIAPALYHHQGPILVLANFDGTWPGLVGALNLEGTLTSLNKKHSRLWSENFDDAFFLKRLEEWLTTDHINHDTSYLNPIAATHPMLNTNEAELGLFLGDYILRKKEIMGLFDTFCMGMINGVFPQKALCQIGMPLEGLSQSMLLFEMSKISLQEREKCLQFYIDQGMQFQFGQDEATELTRNQVLEQCAMLIALTKITDEYGLSLVGVQYQQGLKDQCAASDFAEGAIGSSIRFPVFDKKGEIIKNGLPIPCANEVDMGTAIPQIMMHRLLNTLGYPSESTLHDIRWGSEYNGTFYWDFEISGNVPFSHLKGGIAGAIGYRQPPMYFSKGGSTISGQCKEGSFLWARAHYEGTDVHLHIGTGDSYELPSAEFQRRLKATTDVWPMMNVTLDGIDRNSLMAGHQSNHITVAYIPKSKKKSIATMFAAMAIRLGMKVSLAGI